MQNKTGHFYIIIILFFLIISLPAQISAVQFENAEMFVEHIYKNYASQNFAEVYYHFADELKEELKKKEYIQFQKDNFAKYELSYSNIKVDGQKELNYQDFKNEFPDAENKGKFYSIRVSYKIEFKRFGEREENIEKRVYIREKSIDKTDNNILDKEPDLSKKKYNLFWDPEPILGDKQKEDEGLKNE